MPFLILVERLTRHYDVRAALRVEYGYPKALHVCRVREFRREIARGNLFRNDPHPICVDTDCHGGHFYGPLVTDGHHRLYAAIKEGVQKIWVSYGGPLATLRYLQGRRKTIPWEG